MSVRKKSNSSMDQSLLEGTRNNHSQYGSTTNKTDETAPLLTSSYEQEIFNEIEEDPYVSDGYSVSIPSSASSSYNSLESELEPVSVKDEIFNIFKSAVPLSITFFFEYLLAVTSLFLIGHLGNRELASASLAVMTFNITGLAVFEGMSTCLDTFCSQAFGAKKYHRVGLYTQRCTAMILTCSIPIMIIWWYSKFILGFIVPQQELLDLTQLYLRTLCLGSPGLIFFETAKRFLQSQEIFHASTYVLFICLPLNLAFNYFFIKYWGFIGAPLAISLTYWIMAILLILYAALIDGYQCWNGLTKRALKRWNPMLRLAIPGLVMIESEYLSFEILTVMASYFGTDSLAAQSIISNIGSLTYQLPFAFGCAISTRVAIYVGSGSIQSSRIAVKISYFVALLVGLINFSILIIFRPQFALLFTSDEDVLRLAVKSMPILAFNQICDTFNIIAAGILRSQGRQKIGSILNVTSYYIIALPIAYILAFLLKLEISGLWLGLGTGIFILAVTETICVIRSNWKEIIEDTIRREHEEPEYIIDDSSTLASSASSFISNP